MKHLLIFFILGLLAAFAAVAYTTPKEFDKIKYDADTMTAGELIKELRKYDRDTPIYKVKDWQYTDYRGRMPEDNLEGIDVCEQHDNGYIVILL